MIPHECLDVDGAIHREASAFAFQSFHACRSWGVKEDGAALNRGVAVRSTLTVLMVAKEGC